MEGHFLAAIAESGKSMPNLQFPMIGLLVSGGTQSLLFQKILENIKNGAKR